MRFVVSAAEARRVREFYGVWAKDPFVVCRHRRNARRQHSRVTRAQLWGAYVSALLTTQQRSGRGSAVAAFTAKRPLPLSLRACRRQRNVRRFVERAIREFGGIRRGPTIAAAAAAGLAWLESGGWSELMSLPQLGPKQSRNVLQMLGLTRYETPLDSRIARWLNEFGFPVRLSASSLADADYYELVADGFQALCRAAGLLPCDLDAAIFVSYDEGADPDAPIRW